MKVSIILVFLIIIECYTIIKNVNVCAEEEETDKFIPTKEWQVFKKGQRIPKGLQIRVNAETGQLEARIFEQVPRTQSIYIVPQKSKYDILTKYSERAIKNTIKNTKDNSNSNSETEENKLRSYDELKQDLEDLQIAPKSDWEILSDLTYKHKLAVNKERPQTKEIITILESMEYLLHQYDNAFDFIKLNGFKDIIYEHFNSSDLEVKQEALKVFGAAVQNNPRVQIHALETGAIDQLLRLLALHSDGIKLRALFGLGCLLRRFPAAQSAFIANAGVTVFNKLMDKSTDITVRMKVINLVGDLLEEYDDARKDNYKKQLEQYKMVNMKKHVAEVNWCGHLTELLLDLVDVDPQNTDMIQFVFRAIVYVADDCQLKDVVSLQHLMMQVRPTYNQLHEELIEKTEGHVLITVYEYIEEKCIQIQEAFNMRWKSEL